MTEDWPPDLDHSYAIPNGGLVRLEGTSADGLFRKTGVDPDTGAMILRRVPDDQVAEGETLMCGVRHEGWDRMWCSLDQGHQGPHYDRGTGAIWVSDDQVAE